MAAIAAVIAIIVLCIKHWDEIKEVAKKVTEAMAQAWSDFKQKFSRHWDEMKQKLSTKLNEMRSNWDSFKSNLTNTWNNLKSSISNIASNLRSSVSNSFNNIMSSATNYVNNLKSSISSTIGNIYSTIVNGFGNAVSYITSLPSRAWGWGRDIIDNIVNGIWNAISSLRDAMSNVASTIASYIHFSEPDKGALSNFHTFMPDMMRQLAQGIKDGMPQIDSAMDSLSRSMIPTSGVAGTTNNNTTSNSVSINVYGAQGQDINELAHIIEDKITNNVIRRGVVFA